MRTRELVLLSVVACVLACAQSRPRPAPAPASRTKDIAVVRLKFDFRRVFGGRSSSSMFDPHVIDPALMKRVMVEPDFMAEGEHQKTVETWTRHRLLEALGRANTTIIAPPLPSFVDPKAPCPVGGCYSPPPSAVLRNVRFLSGKDDVRVRVDRSPDGNVVVSLWDADKKSSLCGTEFRLKQGFVELQAQVTRVSDGALAAVISELVLLDAPKNPVLESDSPDPDVDPPAFCRFVGNLFERDPDFARSDDRYEMAAAQTLQAGLVPLFPDVKP